MCHCICSASRRLARLLPPDMSSTIAAPANTNQFPMDNTLLPLVSTIMVPDSQSDFSMDEDSSESGSDSDTESQEAVDENPMNTMTGMDAEPQVSTPVPPPPVGFDTAPDFEMEYDDPMEESESDSGSVEEYSQPQSRLLTLPTEIFQTITWHMDAGTFFTSLLTCRQFFIAARSTPLLLRHIHNLPGLRLGLDELCTEDLLDQFSIRAVESGCGVGVLADVTKYAPTSKIPMSNAVFSPCRWLFFTLPHLCPACRTSLRFSAPHFSTLYRALPP